MTFCQKPSKRLFFSGFDGFLNEKIPEAEGSGDRIRFEVEVEGQM